MPNFRNLIFKLSPVWVWGFFVSTFMVVVLGLWFYSFEYGAARRALLTELKNMAEMKTSELNLWRNAWFSAAEQMRKSPFTQEAVSRYSEFPSPDLSQKLKTYFSNIENALTAEDAGLYTTKGVCILPDTAFGKILPQKGADVLAKAFLERRSVLSEFSHYRSGDDRLFSVIPFFDANGRSVGAVIFSLNPQVIFDRVFAVSSAADFKPSVEMILCDSGKSLRYSCIQNHIRIRVLPEADSLRNLPSETWCGAGRVQTGEAVNAEGERVLAAVSGCDSALELAVSVRLSDLHAKLSPVRWVLSAGGFFVLLIWFGVFYFVWIRLEQKRTDTELDEKKRLLALSRHYELLVREANDIILLLNPDRTVIEFNGRARTVFGYPPEIFLKIRFEQLFVPEEFSRVLAYLDEVRSGVIRLLESSGKRVDGSRFPLEINARKIMIDETPFLQIIARDISERKNVEIALRQSEENFRVTLQGISEAVISVDSHLKVRFMNEGASRLLGVSPETKRGVRLDSFIQMNDTSGEPLVPRFETLLQEGGRLVFSPEEIHLSLEDGRELCSSLGVSALTTPGKAGLGAVFVLRDLTKEQKLEERLRHSQKMNAIAQLAAGIAHEFNNMLTSILGGCELLDTLQTHDARASQYTGLIRHAAERAELLTRKLLAFSRKSAATARTAELTPLLESVLHDFENLKNIRFERNYFDKTLFVRGDLPALRSALFNVIQNGCEAMRSGGVLRIETGVETLDAHDLLGELNVKPGAYARIRISNNGLPIPPENMPRLFEPFFSTKPPGEGSGLGLCATYNIIREHEGLIVPAQTETETVFKIDLPLVQTAETEMKTEPVLTGKAQGCILVIDDEPVVRTIASEMLSRAGYTVLAAQDGAEGVELFEKERSRIDLVLLDMVMPRMDGAETFKRLRLLNPGLKVIIASGYDRTESAEMLLQSGVSAFLSKPYSLSVLTGTVRDVLARQ